MQRTLYIECIHVSFTSMLRHLLMSNHTVATMALAVGTTWILRGKQGLCVKNGISSPIRTKIMRILCLNPLGISSYILHQHLIVHVKPAPCLRWIHFTPSLNSATSNLLLGYSGPKLYTRQWMNMRPENL